MLNTNTEEQHCEIRMKVAYNAAERRVIVTAWMR